MGGSANSKTKHTEPLRQEISSVLYMLRIHDARAAYYVVELRTKFRLQRSNQSR